MQKIDRADLSIWILSIAFFSVTIILFGQYISYLNAIVYFPYDWEPTDGDHLNFIHRLASHLPIYLSISKGEVLSIYNPLYHAIVALFGGENSSLGLARSFTLIFWILIPLVVFAYFRKKWGFLYSIIAAFFIWMPPEPGLLVDMVQIGPSSTMAFFFLVTILYANNIINKEYPGQWEWILLGGLASLTYFAKQQGLIVIAVVIIFLLIQKISKKNIILTLIGFSFVFIPAVISLELANSGEFLNATIFDLKRIMPSSFYLSMFRLWQFLFDSSLYFFIGVLISLFPFIFMKYGIKNLSIWQVSFILHIPFLLVILGNGGGGPNYFFSFWISIVFICIELIKNEKVLQILRFNKEKFFLIIAILIVPTLIGNMGNIYTHLFINFSLVLIVFLIILNKNNKFLNKSDAIFFKKTTLFSLVILFSLFANIYSGMKNTSYVISGMKLPTPELEIMMQDYYDSVALLTVDKKNLHMLSHRNIGAFSTNGFRVNNEGATMFSYAWHSKNIFERKIILDNIRNQKYDVISTGLQAYPKEVMNEIIIYYSPVINKPINFRFGEIGRAIVYLPKIPTLHKN